MTLSSPSVKNPYQLIIDGNYRDELYRDIISYIPEYQEKLSEAGLKNPEIRSGSLYFDFLENPSHHIEYNGKIIIIKTATSNVDLNELRSISPLWNDLASKVEKTEEMITRGIHEKFYSEIFEFKKFAPDKSWAIRRFDIFTEYVIDIRNTNIDHFKIDRELHEYLGTISDRYEWETYPTEFKNQDYIELGRITNGYLTNIVIHDGKYQYNVGDRDDEFDMYIMLKQIERICRQSLDILRTLESVPDEKEEDFLSKFEEQWKVLRNIQAFMNISTMYIERHNALLEAEKGGKMWMIENSYQNLYESVEPKILEAKSKALSYDMIYLTEKDLFLMKKAHSQYESAQAQLTQTEKMLKLNECLLKSTQILVILAISTLLVSIYVQADTKKSKTLIIKSYRNPCSLPKRFWGRIVLFLKRNF